MLKKIIIVLNIFCYLCAPVFGSELQDLAKDSIFKAIIDHDNEAIEKFFAEDHGVVNQTSYFTFEDGTKIFRASPLHLAIFLGYHDVLENLVSKFALKNIPAKMVYSTGEIMTGLTPLIFAVMMNDAESIEILLKKGPNRQYVDLAAKYTVYVPQDSLDPHGSVEELESGTALSHAGYNEDPSLAKMLQEAVEAEELAKKSISGG